MRTVVHLSDLHFGTAQPRVVAGLVVAINERRPDVVAVSGDLTQRARRWQFEDARAFLDQLPFPQIVVPGNHDVPLYDVWRRFAAPLRRFRRHINENLHPYFYDGAVAIIGANTTRSFTIADGGLRPADVRRIGGQLATLDAAIVKIVVCHHPFDAPASRRWTMPRPDAQAMATLAGQGVDIFLTGHLHVGYTGHTAVRYKAEGRAAIVVEAGTAASTRLRGEANSFNVIRIEDSGIAVERLAWDAAAAAFQPVDTVGFRRSADGWSNTAS